MATWGFGLRAKSLLALVLAGLLALAPAGLIGWQVLEGVRHHFGEAYARNFTLLKRQSILAPVSRDLALALRLADSEVTRQWLLDEQNLEKKTLFFKEAEGYRRDFRSNSYFISSSNSRQYYFNDDHEESSDQPRYTLDQTKKSDTWFFSSIRQVEPYNINVNYDDHLKITQVWLNIIIRNGEQVLGLAGTGLNLSTFLKDFISTDEPGITPLIINRDGAIQAHRNPALIATNLAASSARLEQTLAGQLQPGPEREAAAVAMAAAQASPGQVSSFKATLDGREQLLALAYIPDLKWHVVTAIDLQAAQVLDQRWLNTAIAALVALIAILLLTFAYAVEQLVLKPLRKLQISASAMAQGDFDVSLPPPSRDELGDLSQAFGIMARQVRDNTAELESKVQARTQDLEAANRNMQRAHQQINDSIDYASLIQKAILPNQQLLQQLGAHHFVLWRPRDVVGGDFYVFRAEDDRYLVGVVDCAGHGVPGALMTMLARAALDHAMTQEGIAAPAAILTQTDATMRAMLQHCDLPRAIATNMDAGLAHVDRTRRLLRFAGAKIGLYWSDGEQVGEYKGGRRAIGDRRVGSYTDTEIELRPGITYYLATDGFLDQAGGDLGYGFGNTRFAQLLRSHARLPMAQQASALDQALAAYQGEYPQRDDITVLSFRFD
ncbi:MAG: biofilm regulation protein phosphatase SiaA [Azovibrio sp.]|uniref:biofilm regulation protein phosphatase SiaA n=1 Tax=Azovibrio sp. TaxID=1872673 RepID=UPI003C75B341